MIWMGIGWVETILIILLIFPPTWALGMLSSRQMSLAARTLWVVIIVVIPLLGPLSFFFSQSGRSESQWLTSTFITPTPVWHCSPSIISRFRDNRPLEPQTDTSATTYHRPIPPQSIRTPPRNTRSNPDDPAHHYSTPAIRKSREFARHTIARSSFIPSAFRTHTTSMKQFGRIRNRKFPWVVRVLSHHPVNAL
jgi:hypothetical protein